ncbi:MAG: hypothetical protein HFJ55_03645 [Clostridia bacterium]|nr:hypothetical protein [Clostridia bacterium]
MLSQTQKLVSIFNKEQLNNIENIIERIEKDGQDYKTINLWQFDQTIGGIGGYCQGCDPAKSNPFQGTEFRNVYRCLQYIRSDIDILDVNYTARDIIENCGHHFEESIKVYLKKNKKINWIKVSRYPLGKLLNYITDKNIFEEKITERLKLFVALYNISKHEILSNDELDRTFHADDAITCYFACRIVGKEILLKTDAKREQQTFEIDWKKYSRNINRF